MNFKNNENKKHNHTSSILNDIISQKKAMDYSVNHQTQSFSRTINNT